jgi:hypothetical protein
MLSGPVGRSRSGDEWDERDGLGVAWFAIDFLVDRAIELVKAAFDDDERQ